jgi:hypothetical protein
MYNYTGVSSQSDFIRQALQPFVRNMEVIDGKRRHASIFSMKALL